MESRITREIKRMLINDLFVEMTEEQIGLDDGLQTKLGLDSVSFVELKLLCEQHFGLAVDDSEFSPENFRSVWVLAQFIETKLNSQATSHGN
jgi:acyl carrier protein